VPTSFLFAVKLPREISHRRRLVDAAAPLERFQVARVAADPAVVPDAAHPGGWCGFAYHRLHGSPRMYHSPYRPAALAATAAALRPCDWCILDNTALGAAAGDALRVLGLAAA
jgi:uncharacterized protein YecE (DUF72 family)